MTRKRVHLTLKELTAQISRTNSHSPEQLMRLLTIHKIEALANAIDELSIEMDNRLLQLESKIEDLSKGKKNAKKN